MTTTGPHRAPVEAAMNVVLVVDELDRLDPATDTSVGLMHAAQDRGAAVRVTTPSELSVVKGKPGATARQLCLAPSHPAGGCAWTVPDPWMSAGPPEHVNLDDADAIFMWVEPPLDAAYLAATFVLDLVHSTPVVNDPRGLRACSEHLMPLRFPDLIPPTLVSADIRALYEFVAAQRVAVLKPVDGYAGHGVYRLGVGDPNLASLLETATAGGTRLVVAQRYLPEVDDGNKRVFVLDGIPVSAVYRYPAAGDFRIGQPSAQAPLTTRDRHICARLAPVLASYGVRVAGLDVIGPHLIEVNITSPGALRKADALLGWSLCADVLDLALHDAAPRDAAFSDARFQRRFV
ncbi:glutathione synthase [Protofrankia coriariae]|uniref:glutathione synthase n=1 Tax=Protofrankia coriariae TaxID=1562887 RepID=UPI000A704F6D|nr:glutathione synthase [Protofrankia coriariae]